MYKQQKRLVEIVVISDVHLGTFGCHAKELNRYLKTIDPGILILNGDIIDFWQLSKWYWPQSHTKVLKRLLKLSTEGTTIYYLTGNHDEILRKYCDMNLGNIFIRNKLEMLLDGKKIIFFHGDVFDFSINHSKWLAKLGGYSYDLLILLNRLINFVSVLLGKEKFSLSKKVKDNFKTAMKYIGSFEDLAIKTATDKGFDAVFCGHIHKPIISKKDKIVYLNSGDWIENLTSLEYSEGEWALYKYNKSEEMETMGEEDISSSMPATAEILKSIFGQ
ncbi:MAG: UDP-2,3-diacylglucosamine diphosphatase [Bacteroidota bacterium]|nr:UDP-2,3-diacylglucosamine diphosphatase [Bacteroidota bacterium]